MPSETVYPETALFVNKNLVGSRCVMIIARFPTAPILRILLAGAKIVHGLIQGLHAEGKRLETDALIVAVHQAVERCIRL